MLNLFKKKPALTKASLEKSVKKSAASPKPDVPAAKKEPPLKTGAKTASSKFPPGILVAPHITEKATRLMTGANQYVFEVADNANADLVRRAVEGKYGVHVKKVNMLKSPGKKVRLGREVGWSKGFKKAMVTLAKGQSIEFT